MTEYEFVTRSIPTLWNSIEGVLLVSSTGFAPGSIYGSTFVAWYNASNCFHGVLEYSRERSKDRLRIAAGAYKLSGCYATKGTLSVVVLMSLIEGLLPAQSCVVFIMHLVLARHTALCRDAAPLRAIIGSCGARLARSRARPVGVAPHTRPAMHMRGPLSS